MITLYTDGSASVTDHSGGWAWWVNDNLYDAGHVSPATNNQMELMAVWFGLRALAFHGEPVKVVSDSAYVVNCFKDRWYVKWRANVDLQGRWRSANGKKEVSNQELWQRVLMDVERYPAPIEWQHCRGHGRGGPEDAPYVDGNDVVDRLASAGRKSLLPGRPYSHGEAGAAVMAGAFTKLRKARKRQ